MSGAITVLLFRLAVALLLYLFLFEVVRAVWREISPVAVRGQPGYHPANLEVVQPARARLQRGEVIALHDAMTIGREADNDLVVDEETVSSRHARLVLRDGRWWIEDLGSTNGTWVNDAHVVGRRPLGPGDVIQMGRVQVRFSA